MASCFLLVSCGMSSTEAGSLIGSTSGSLLGSYVGSVVGGNVGSVIGGIGGSIGGSAAGVAIANSGNRSYGTKVTQKEERIVTSNNIPEATYVAHMDDGVAFNAIGQIKSIDYKGGPKEEFDVNGQYVPSSYYAKLKRDDNGRIGEINLGQSGWHSFFEYGTDGALSVRRDVNPSEALSYGLNIRGAGSVSHKYQYDSKGYVSAETMTVEFDDGNNVKITNPKTFSFALKYKTLGIDAHGNWTKRRVYGEGVELSNKGFEKAGTNEYGEVYYAKKNIDYTEERVITYY